MLEIILRNRANGHDSPALRDLHGQWLSYGQLDQWSNRIAGYLHDSGVRKGDRVATLMHNSSLHVALFFAVVKIGAIIVPVNPSLNPDLIDRMIRDIEPVMVLDDYGSRGIKSETFSTYRGESYSPAYFSDDNRPAMILFTGGTTGDPKGAVIPVRSIVWNAFNTITSWNLTSDDSTLVSLPLYHTGGWNVLLLPLLVAGGRVTIGPDKFDAAEALKTIAVERITQYMAVPAMLSAMVRLEEFNTSDLSATRFISGGGGLPSKTFEILMERRIRIFQGYGLTEAGPNNFNIPCETFARKPGSVGKPNMFVDMKLMEDGELAIKGPHLFAGYWNRPDARPFNEEGFLLTGDIFEIDAEGDYSYVDRKKNMIKTGGENVYASEVEAELIGLPGVSECCVIGLPHDHWGEMVTAFVVSGQEGITEEFLRGELKKRLAGFKVPKRIIFIDTIPKSDIGKPLKNKLREEYEKSIHQ